MQVKELLDKEFLRAVADNLARGIKGTRTANDWQERDLAGFFDRLFAIERHVDKYRKSRDRRHFASIACNAMICWVLHDKLGR